MSYKMTSGILLPYITPVYCTPPPRSFAIPFVSMIPPHQKYLKKIEIKKAPTMYINSIYIKFREIKMTSAYSEALCAWLQQHDVAKMTTKYVARKEAKFDTWLREFMVTNNFSMRLIERCVSIDELFDDFENGVFDINSMWEEIIATEKQELIDSGEDEYDWSYRENEDVPSTYSEALWHWLQQQDATKMTPKYVACLEAEFDTWLHELMVRNNFSMRLIKGYVYMLFDEFVNRNQEELDEICEDIGIEKQERIDSGEVAYDLSYRENEEYDDSGEYALYWLGLDDDY